MNDLVLTYRCADTRGAGEVVGHHLNEGSVFVSPNVSNVLYNLLAQASMLSEFGYASRASDPHALSLNPFFRN